jgi:Flp pilus assembly protein TadG
MRRMTRPGLHDEGAIAVIVAILFGTFVVLSCAALTIDVGNINLDRRQLQNSADAVALAVAQDCANTGTCHPNDPSLQTLANANSAHGATAIRRVDGLTPICGNAPGLVSCPAASAPNSANLQECPGANPADSTQYVRVYTETLQKAGGAHILPYTFGAAIAGVGSGANQQACASVSWGAIGTYTTGAPITISLCMFDAMKAAVGGVGNLPPPPDSTFPGYGPGHASAWPSSSLEQIEYTTKYAGSCTNSNGHAANGSFGWLTNISCMATATTGNWIQGDPGNNMACDMSPYWGKKILVPIYDCVVTSGSDPGAPPLPTDTCKIPSGGGSNIWYHIAGWASFYLSGYRFPGNSQPSTLTGNAICGSPDSCLGGWLTSLELSNASTGGGSNYGVSAVKVLG